MPESARRTGARCLRGAARCCAIIERAFARLYAAAAAAAAFAATPLLRHEDAAVIFIIARYYAFTLYRRCRRLIPIF